jgi:hypothetical protein
LWPGKFRRSRLLVGAANANENTYKYQSKPAAVRHVLRLLFRSKQSKCCSEEENDGEEGRGPQIIVLPRITLNKHLGFRRDRFLSLLPCLQGDKDFGAKKTKIKIKIKPSTAKHLL